MSNTMISDAVLANETLTRPRNKYMKTLDGWRAVAIIWVMFNHDGVHHIGRLSLRWITIHGYKGVDIFFAISGILITKRLLDEEKKRGVISLRDFYLRRAFRILPAAFAYLASLCLLAALGKIILYPAEVWSSLLFLRNYPDVFGRYEHAVPQAWFTGHFWSLAVEEHFYFILPALLVGIRSRTWRMITLGALSVAVIANRGIQMAFAAPGNFKLFHTDVRLDALLLPALLAIFLDGGTTLKQAMLEFKVKRALRFWPQIALLWLVSINIKKGTLGETTATSLLMPLIIMGAILHSDNWIGRILEWDFLKFVGRLSYSIYLWQMLFFTGFLYKMFPLGRLEHAPYNWIATMVMSLLSYYFIEKPMIRLGHRWAPSATPGR